MSLRTWAEQLAVTGMFTHLWFLYVGVPYVCVTVASLNNRILLDFEEILYWEFLVTHFVHLNFFP